VFAEDEKDGRYKGFIMSDARSFIILDSETGSVKWCHLYTFAPYQQLQSTISAGFNDMDARLALALAIYRPYILPQKHL
tara:strand:- start:275 stop:511 length:237 start_codon:yes stop_codon:yes gene_type:complete